MAGASGATQPAEYMEFHNRVNAVFGALRVDSSDQAEAAPWELSKTQVHRIGNLDYSSDEDTEAAFRERLRTEVIPGTLIDMEDMNDTEGGFQPSTKFLAQLDQEDEYDAVDEVAMGTWRKNEEAKPARDTEVLEDNVWELRCKHQASASLPLLASPDSGPLPTSADTPSTSTGTNVSAPLPSALASPAKKRKQVTFSPDVLDSPGKQHRSDHSAFKQRAQANTNHHSFVPDHVKNPQRYTCYTLDEPLTVGGGVGQAAGGENEQALYATHSAAGVAHQGEQSMEVDEGRHVPQAGAGLVEFRPRVKADKPMPGASAPPPVAVAVADTYQDAEEVVDGAAEHLPQAHLPQATAGTAAGDASQGFKARGPRQRHLRARGATQRD